MQLLMLLVTMCFVSPNVICSTTIKRNNPLLVRHKRYLSFPDGSNFIITPSMIKPLLLTVPRGFTTLAECDVPFLLPTLAQIKMIKGNFLIRQRREIRSNLEFLFSKFGLDASACLHSAVCEIEGYKFPSDRFLLKHLSLATASYLKADITNRTRSCSQALIECGEEFLPYMLQMVSI